jgi:hypothetical protein
MKKTTILAALAVLSLGFGVVGDSIAQQAPAPRPAPGQGRGAERHPDIRHAMRALNNAKHFLQQGAHDFGGHRVKAEQLCDEAIAQCQAALRADKN